MGEKRHKKRRREREARSERPAAPAAAVPRGRRGLWIAASLACLAAAAAVLALVLARRGAQARVPIPAEWPRLKLGDVALPVYVARTLADRERLVPPRIDRRRPLTQFFRRHAVAAGVLFAYPDEQYRSVHLDHDVLGGSLGLLFLDARGGIVGLERIGAAGKLVLSPGLARFILFVPGDWLAAHRIDPACTVALPESVFGNAEPEYTRIPDPVRIHVNGVPLDVEVAATAHLRMRGLMYRNYVDEGTGMLFLFRDAAPQKFWMRNTRVALDCAYIDADHVIRNIVTMRPHDLDADQKYGSDGAVVMALETPAGWFRKHAVQPGHRVEIGQRLEARRRTADP